MNPKFPVIWFGERYGVMYFETAKELSTTQLMLWGPLSFEGDSIIDSLGIRWELSIESRDRASLLERIKVLFGRYVEISITYAFQLRDTYNLDSIKARLIEYSEHDSGDVMLQFIEHDKIVAGIKAAEEIEELFEFVNSMVCSESEA